MWASQLRGLGGRLFYRRYSSIIVLGGLAIVIFILYTPSITAPFQGDDFNWIRYILFRFPALLDGREWGIFLTPFMTPGTWTLFRPGFQLLFLLDYTAWGLDPLGYHLVNLILHILIAFLVFVLGKQLTRDQRIAIVAGTLFAVMPIHVEAVAWFAARADELSAIWYLLSLIFYIYYRMRGRVRFLIVAMIAFGMSLMAKEASVTLPIMMVLYDFLYERKKQIKLSRLLVAEIPFWSLLVGYLVLRLALLQVFGGLVGSQLSQANPIYFAGIYLTALADPFLPDVMDGMLVALIGLGLAVLIIFRKNHSVVFGLIWLAVTILPSSSSLDGLIFDRFAYLPTVGLALALASLLLTSFDRYATWLRIVVFATLTLLVLAYSVALYNRNGDYARSAQVTRLVTDGIRALHPTLPVDAQIFIEGLPGVAVTRGVQAFGWVVDRAMQVAYKNPNIKAQSVSRFPLITDHLDSTFLFEYNRRKITERSDVFLTLAQRSACANSSTMAVEWDFSQDTQGWEALNQLSDFVVHDGMLTMRSVGNDPYLISPEFGIPAIAIASVDVTMRARGESPTLSGELYWLATDQSDFLPNLNVPFTIQADNEFHTYHVDIGNSGKLYVGDQITQLRLNPGGAPAEIAIKSIRVYTHCSSVRNEYCFCES